MALLQPDNQQPKAMVTGGTAPTTTVRTMSTGGNTPPTAVASKPALMSGVADFRNDFNEGDRAAVTREVQGNELSGNQLSELTSGNSKYIRSARQNSAAAAADRGMLMSSVAVGAGEKAAIDAAQPFAMQQADAYGRTASENMAARNADNQADQSAFREMGSRQQQLEAQSVEANRTRDYTTAEQQKDRDFRGGQAQLDRSFQSDQSSIERGWRSGEAQSDRDLQVARDSTAARENRQNQYFNLIANREAQMSQVLNAIYSNPNLKPEQQAAAAANARALMSSLANSYNSVFSQGVPPIFMDPYVMNTGGTAPVSDPIYTPPPPGTTPTTPPTWSPTGGFGISP